MRPPVIFILSFIVFVLGCGVVRKSSTSHANKETQISSKEVKSSDVVDSSSYIETTIIDTTSIREESIEASVSTDSIASLYDLIEKLNFELLKAKYESGSKAGGQIIYDTIEKRIYLRATCDSSEILSLRKSIRELRYRASQRNTSNQDSLIHKSEVSKVDESVKTRGYSFFEVLGVALASLLAGGLLTFILKIGR